MKIVCPTCTTSYDVGPAALGASGRSVRCVRCRTVWFATPVEEPAPVEEPVLAAPADAAPPAPEPGQDGEGDTRSEDFDWSFSVDGSQASAGTDGTASEAAGDDAEGKSQADIDAMWAAAEAESVVETKGPSIVPAMEADAAGDSVVEHNAGPTPESIESVAARRAPKAKRPTKRTIKLPSLGLPAAIVLMIAVLGALVGFRSHVVRFAPQTASLYGAIGLPVNLRGLTFENVRTTGEVHEGVPVLIVEGTIANVVNKTVEVPRLRFAMRNPAGQEIYAWTSVTGRSILSPGETTTFRSRLASPPSDGREVVVRFLSRRDLVAGMR
jgi:predicted Zn finger-like uncharacterized protein